MWGYLDRGLEGACAFALRRYAIAGRLRGSEPLSFVALQSLMVDVKEA